MAKVNYIKECRAFTMLAAEERLSANEVVLWHALFELFNRRAENENWPDGFIQIGNAKLLALTTFGAGDSGCEILRKTREKLQARGLIKYRKGRRSALTPEYCLCYFFAEKSEAADTAETPEPIRPKSTNPGRWTGKPLDIPLNVNLNGNPNPGHTQFLTGRGNPRANDDLGHTDGSGYDQGWKTSAKARGAIAQRLLDQYDGLLDTRDAWGDLCEVMADGLSPEAIEAVMPARPAFSRLIARLRALVACGKYGFTDKRDRQNSPRAGP